MWKSPLLRFPSVRGNGGKPAVGFPPFPQRVISTDSRWNLFTHRLCYRTIIFRTKGLCVDAASAEITVLLKAWSGGDPAALDRLAELVYPELRLMARRYMKNERLGNTLQATALVHEVYLRLVDVTKGEWRERAQFFAMAAQMMRRVLVNAAHARAAEKRGGRMPKVNIDETAVLSPSPDRSILALDEALTVFSRLAPRQAKVVELRYFGGLTEEEIVAALNISPRTVRRDWDFAKAWLSQELNR